MQTKLYETNEARVFFALWPSAALQQKLYGLGGEYQEGGRARRLRQDNLHLTLVFVGAVERERLPTLMQAAAKVAFEPFTFSLQRLACWKHNHLAFATSETRVPELDQLALRIAQEIEAAGFKYDRRDFYLHVTLLRNLNRVLAPQSIAPVEWPVTGFSLVETELGEQGARYRILGTWPQA